MKNNKSVTAVEWLISELRESKDFHRVINELNQRSSAVRHILNEAKEMEKEQIIDAFDEGNPHAFIPKDGQQYFNETYKQQTP